MAFFNVSADGNALHWDYVEENEEGDVVPVDATRTHVLHLRTVVDVSPNNSLASLSSNDVFALRITVQDGGELNIIAPSKTDFAVWFYGLAFLQAKPPRLKRRPHICFSDFELYRHIFMLFSVFSCSSLAETHELD
jgi:hypothetical protein